MELLRAVIVVYAFLHALVHVTARPEDQVQEKFQLQGSAHFHGLKQFQAPLQSQTQVLTPTDEVRQPDVQPHKPAQSQTQPQPQPQKPGQAQTPAQPNKQAPGQTQAQPQPQRQTQKPGQTHTAAQPNKQAPGQTQAQPQPQPQPQRQTQKPGQTKTPAQPQQQVFIPKTPVQQNQQGMKPPTQEQPNQQGMQPPTQGQQKQRGLQPPTPGPPQAPTTYSQSTLRDMYNKIAAEKPQAYLSAHNTYRQQNGAPPLQWDKKLEDYASNYASKCAKDCIMKHSYGPYGENLYWEQYEESTPAQVVQSFMAEAKNYDMQAGKCSCIKETGKCMCGHFTAVIWKKTERVGCAEAKCEAEKGKLVVCSYDPPGNRVGEHPLDYKQ